VHGKKGQPAGPGVEALARLTRREMELLRLLAQGRRNREIAQTLFISEKTVRNHVSNIMRKTGLQDRTQVALWAVGAGIVK